MLLQATFLCQNHRSRVCDICKLAALTIWISQIVLGPLCEAGDEHDFAAALQRLSDPALRLDESARILTDYRSGSRLVHAALHASKRVNAKPSTQLIRLAGEMRLFDCSRLLADNIDVEAAAAFGDGPLRGYPAAEALVEFGSRGYNGVFERLEHGTSDRQLRIIACVFLQVDGKALAALRLENKLQEHLIGRPFQSVDDDLAKNLRRLREIISTVDFTKAENWP